MWTRSETLPLAKESCAHCHGLGQRSGRRGQLVPCNCVFRAIFRACFSRFRYCATKEKRLSQVSLQLTSGRNRRVIWGRKDEEYVTDFCNVSRRALTEEEHKIFRYHYLLGGDWKLCCRKLKMDRGNFFHAVYRIEQKLGRAYRELKPYSLYPLNEYFNSTYSEEPVRAFEAPNVVTIRPVRPPLAPAPGQKAA